jgi:hypothetical protein
MRDGSPISPSGQAPIWPSQEEQGEHAGSMTPFISSVLSMEAGKG